MASPAPDRWSRWVLDRQYGSDRQQEEAGRRYHGEIRDRVLRNAAVHPGEVVLDVGAGNGLIAFGALDLVGPAGLVVFTDLSEALLAHCRQVADDRGVTERCRFELAPAEDLAPIEDGSIDVLTTRSVLIYVAHKARAFAEFFRVLGPGGRISIFEPINRYFGRTRDRLWGYEVAGVEDLAARVFDLYERLQPPDRDPMLNFGERDLLRLAEEAGFGEVHAELSIQIRPQTRPTTWSAFANSAPNPLVPTFGEAISEVLSADEAARLEAHLRPLVESGRGVERSAAAYLWATKSS